MQMDFDATLELDGKTATGITVPPGTVEALGAGKRPAVLVTINGHTFATTIGSVRGTFKIPVSADRRGHIHAEAGDAVRVSVVLDTAPAKIEIPSDLASALATDPVAGEFFSGLTPSQQKGFVVPIDDAKTADTRVRRIDKAMTALKAQQKRP
jgi:Bacteriocin-protection, YdeI or OmpD-Associated/Domain of unknown function (DUF1905)